ncbi:MAG: isochorismatase family protein [Rhodospirillaceae bacterium]|nr:isochorismatase family protein [Rhodospirillaceae bacterium]
MKPALIVIDMQKAFYKGQTAPSMDQACDYINAAIPLFRQKKLPVIWVQDMDKEDGVVPGVEGFELINPLKPQKSDKKIIKQYGNGFNKTDLKSFLDQSDIDTVILSGYCAENCVLSTYRGAQDLDFTAVMLRGSLASGKEENITFVENISQIISYGVLKKILAII